MKTTRVCALDLGQAVCALDSDKRAPWRGGMRTQLDSLNTVTSGEGGPGDPGASPQELII